MTDLAATPPRPRRVRRVMLVLALISTALTLWTGWSTLAFILRSAVAPGEVTGAATGSSRKGELFPVVTFRTPDGQAFTFTSDVAATGGPQVGSRVSVRYDPARPQASGRLNSVQALTTGVGLGIVFSGLLMLGALSPLLRRQAAEGRGG